MPSPSFPAKYGAEIYGYCQGVRATPAGDADCTEDVLWTSDAEGRQWSEQGVSHVPIGRGPASE